MITICRSNETPSQKFFASFQSRKNNDFDRAFFLVHAFVEKTDYSSGFFKIDEVTDFQRFYKLLLLLSSATLIL